MKKFFKLLVCILLVSLVIQVWGMWKDGKTLKDSLARLHVIDISDLEINQDITWQVKEAVATYLQPIMDNMPDKEQALQYLNNYIANIEKIFP